VVALESLEVPDIETYTSDSLFYGGKKITLGGKGRFVSRGLLLSHGLLSSQVLISRILVLLMSKMESYQVSHFQLSNHDFPGHGRFNYLKMSNPGK